ncbi:universal stress protein [Enterococcus sp. LJL98]
MEQTYKKILVGIDGSEHAKAAFKKAVEVARRNAGEVFVAAVVEQQVPLMMGASAFGDSYIEEESRRANLLLDECLAYGETVDFTNIKKVLTFGQAKSMLAIELPREHQIDLVMVGQSGLNAVEKMMVGSVASYVIRKAPCDVLVVTKPEEEKK